MLSKVLILVLVPCLINTISSTYVHQDQVEKINTLSRDILPGLLASHMSRSNHTIHNTHVITSKIEEMLPNGCYKQVLRESKNPDKFEETLIWICPPGSNSEKVPAFVKPCSRNCSERNNNNNTKSDKTLNPNSINTTNIHQNTFSDNSTRLDENVTYIIVDDSGNNVYTNSVAVSPNMSNFMILPTFLVILFICST